MSDLIDTFRQASLYSGDSLELKTVEVDGNRKTRILLVDDDKHLCKFFPDAFRMMGYEDLVEIATAYTVDQALTGGFLPHQIYLDVTRNGCSFSLEGAIHAMHEWRPDARLLITSARPSDQVLPGLNGTGKLVDGYEEKPLMPIADFVNRAVATAAHIAGNRVYVEYGEN